MKIVIFISVLEICGQVLAQNCMIPHEIKIPDKIKKSAPKDYTLFEYRHDILNVKGAEVIGEYVITRENDCTDNEETPLGQNYSKAEYDASSQTLSLHIQTSLYEENYWPASKGLKIYANIACADGNSKHVSFFIDIEDENLNPPAFGEGGDIYEVAMEDIIHSNDCEKTHFILTVHDFDFSEINAESMFSVVPISKMEGYSLQDMIRVLPGPLFRDEANRRNSQNVSLVMTGTKGYSKAGKEIIIEVIARNIVSEAKENAIPEESKKTVTVVFPPPYVIPFEECWEECGESGFDCVAENYTLHEVYPYKFYQCVHGEQPDYSFDCPLTEPKLVFCYVTSKCEWPWDCHKAIQEKCASNNDTKCVCPKCKYSATTPPTSTTEATSTTTVSPEPTTTPTGPTSTLPDRCPACRYKCTTNEEGYLYPHEEPSMYLICNHQQLIERQCSQGLIFCFRRGRCEYSHTPNCDVKPPCCPCCEDDFECDYSNCDPRATFNIWNYFHREF